MRERERGEERRERERERGERERERERNVFIDLNPNIDCLKEQTLRIMFGFFLISF